MIVNFSPETCRLLLALTQDALLVQSDARVLLQSCEKELLFALRHGLKGEGSQVSQGIKNGVSDLHEFGKAA